MYKNLYAIYDTVSELFNNPFTDINDQSAIRAFTQSVTEQPHKNDYVLYHIAGYDDNSGMITQNKNPVKIKSGIEINTATVSSITPEMQRQDLENTK